MYETLLNKYGVNQLGFYVEDAEKAAYEHSKLFGSGPFMIMDHVASDRVLFRGQEIDYDMRIAYGHHKNLQIELIQVLSSDPNPYAEMGRYGFHHVSIWSDDPEQVVRDFQEAGYELAMEMDSVGMKVYYIDCREPWDFYVEVHQPLTDFWQAFAGMAENWDGENPVQNMM